MKKIAYLILFHFHFILVSQTTLSNEPLAQPSNLIFTSIKSYRVAAAYSAASPIPKGYLVLRKTGTSIVDIPIDGIMYKRGDNIGESQVVSVGNYTSFSPNHIVAGTNYYFAIFSFNGADSTINYLTDNPLIANAISLNTMLSPNYYGGISTTSSTFVSDLHKAINPHEKQSYSDYRDKFIIPFIARDTIDNQRVITCFYSGEHIIYSEPWDWTTFGFSREHSYPQSWMPWLQPYLFYH